MIKIGLDIHGVIDTNPEFFSALTKLLSFNNGTDQICEIHILTGSRLGNGKIRELLDENKIKYHHLFSISDYLNENCVPELEKSTKENPFFKKEDWDLVKADYCRRNEIDLMVDDTDAYIEHFTTPFARYYSRDK